MKITGITVVLAWVGITAAFAQDVTSKPAPAVQVEADLNKTTDFRILFQERQDLIEQLQVLNDSYKEVQETADRVGPADKLDGTLRVAQSDLAALKKSNKPDQQKIASFENYIESLKLDLKMAQESGPKLKQITAEDTKKRNRLFAVEQRIASLYDATRDVNRFRSSATYTFGVLVFIVVCGFYLIAWYKEGVAKTIFSGELGMQLITLFLIVIAIILFGIMGTLEGKELAALLGGLSGYILGKVGGKSSTNGETVH